MTDDSNFGMRSARNGSPVERPALADATASALVCRTRTGLSPLAVRRTGTTVGPSPAEGDGLPRLWIPTASRAPATGRRNAIPGVREEYIIDVIAKSFPEQFLPILKGLSWGKSDVTVSRLIDMSPRTFSRKVAELLAYLDVETRFQAGMEVAHRWMLSADQRRA
jgi:hypothetical protein